MVLRTKLLFYFFSISVLIIIVGMVFYFQLKNLIEPLTPASIPHSVEQLAHDIDRNEIINNLKYQELLAEHHFEDYIFTGRMLALQKYYKNVFAVRALLEKARSINPAQFTSLQNKFEAISAAQEKMVMLMQANAQLAMKQYIDDKHYRSLLHNFNVDSRQYFYRPDTYTNESAVVTVKLAAKNSHEILKKSLNTTLIVFVDAILASLILVFLSTRAIVRPLNQLRNNIEEMNIEKFSLQINPSLLRLNSEVGDLARSFLEVIHRLQVATVLRDELMAEIIRHRKTELALEETAAMLHESNLDLDQFAYAASHDLRSPLKTIENLTKSIEEECHGILPVKSRENLELIKNRVHHLEALIAGMLEFSSAGRLMQDQETIALNHLLPEIIDTLMPPANIKIHINSNLPVLITSKAKITQVFLNLISNAIKYNDKKQGYINIGHEVMDHYYQFYIEDNGSGVEPQDHEKIFEIFKTAQSGDTTMSSGIGLAIVKKIIEKKGGRIWLTSKLHKGTTFFFTWPMN